MAKLSIGNMQPADDVGDDQGDGAESQAAHADLGGHLNSHRIAGVFPLAKQRVDSQ